MSAGSDIRVLFRAPAGARRGFGHLLRCRSLARALGVRPLVCLRGTTASVDVALWLGCDVVSGAPHRLIAALRTELVVVDDPIVAHASRWIAAARATGAAVASIHDLGLGCHAADLIIDGSVTTTPALANRDRTIGPAFAIVDPALPQVHRQNGARPNVVVSLGGGPRAEVACAIASEIARHAPDVDVRVVGGFVSTAPSSTMWEKCPPNVVWVGASTNLAAELGNADVAVVGGGVSLYEACALGVAAVGVPVVPAQRPTVAGFVARGAALGRPRSVVVPRRVAEDALALLREARLRRRIVQTARRLVDGRGAMRAARALERLVGGR